MADYLGPDKSEGDQHTYLEFNAMKAAVNSKQDKETGKGLSTNDYSTAEKNKLSGIQAGATAYSDSQALAVVNSQKGQANGLVPTDGTNKIPAAYLPDIAVTEFLGSVASQSAMLALTGQRGDWCIRTDVNKVYILIADNASVLASWQAMIYPASGSSAWGSIIGNLVDQTDLKAALDAKAPLNNAGLTGVPTAPTAAQGTNTLQLATTAFVLAELAANTLYFEPSQFQGDLTSGNPLAVKPQGLAFNTLPNVTSSKILGRYAGTNGVIQELFFGSGFSINSTTGEITYSGGGGGGASDVVLVSTTNYSGAIQYDFPLTTLLATYKVIRFRFFNLKSGSGNNQCHVRFSTDGGTTFDSAGASYNSKFDYGGGVVSGDGTKITLTDVLGAASGSGFDGDLILYNFAGTQKSRCRWQMAGVDQSNGLTVLTGAGFRNAEQDTDAIRVFFEATTGSFTLQIWGEK